MPILSSTSTAASSGADSATKAQLAKDKLDKDLNQFLNLLVTQLQNQDPLKPLDANQFTQQLVQFASVEQQIYQNSNLEKLVGIQQGSQVSSMVNYLDNVIEANGSAFNLSGSKGKFSYNLEAKARESTLTIQDANGATMWAGPASLDKGKQVFVWDGLKNDGTLAPDGPYTAVVTAKDKDKNLINVAQTVYGRVTGAGADQGNVILSMGAIDAPLDQVLNVSRPTAAFP